MNHHPYLASLLLLLTATIANADATRRIDIPTGIQRVVIETAGDLEIRPGAPKYPRPSLGRTISSQTETHLEKPP